MKKFIKRYLISGTIVLVPVVATIWILRAVILWLDETTLSLLPRPLRPEFLLGYNIPGIGLVVTIILILLVGIFTRLYIGKVFVRFGDNIFARLPFGRAIYQAIKQVLHTALSEEGQKNRRAVLVEYPLPGTYAIAFLTGECDATTSPDPKKKYMRVFVPTAPNPTSGFILMVPEEAVIPTGMTTEDASKLLISGGLLSSAKNPAPR